MSEKVVSIETTYRAVMFGRDEPQEMFIYGATLKKMAEEIGKHVTHATDGKEIQDGEMYSVTKRGIYEV